MTIGTSLEQWIIELKPAEKLQITLGMRDTLGPLTHSHTQGAIALLQLRPIRISNPTLLLLLFSPISSEIGQMCTHTIGKSKSIRRGVFFLPPPSFHVYIV